MSVVSGVTLLTSLAESDDDGGALDLCGTLNDWMETSRYPPAFREISDAYRGNKHPQQLIFGAGLNYFDEDAFAEFVLGLPWSEPENVVLVIQPEEGRTRIFRPRVGITTS